MIAINPSSVSTVANTSTITSNNNSARTGISSAATNGLGVNSALSSYNMSAGYPMGPSPIMMMLPGLINSFTSMLQGIFSGGRNRGEEDGEKLSRAERREAKQNRFQDQEPPMNSKEIQENFEDSFEVN